MNLILTDEYVAAIVNDWEEVLQLVKHRPSHVKNFMILVSDLIEFPFYILQLGDGSFVPYQEAEDAIFAHPHDCVILFTILGQYLPKPAWSDQMGSLPHQHMDER